MSTESGNLDGLGSPVKSIEEVPRTAPIRRPLPSQQQIARVRAIVSGLSYDLFVLTACTFLMYVIYIGCPAQSGRINGTVKVYVLRTVQLHNGKTAIYILTLKMAVLQGVVISFSAHAIATAMSFNVVLPHFVWFSAPTGESVWNGERIPFQVQGCFNVSLTEIELIKNHFNEQTTSSLNCTPRPLALLQTSD